MKPRAEDMVVMWETRLHAVAPCARAFYRERLRSEVDALREADHLDHVLDVVDALLAARGAGVATVPALRTSELLVFYLAGVSDVDPVTEGLDGRLSINSARTPTCSWFGSGDGAHLVPCVPLVVLSRSLTPERVHSSTLWHDDARAELAALDAWRRAWGEDGPQAETPEVTTWDELVLRQALRTPAAEARSLYGQVRDLDRAGPRSPARAFARTGGVPVFEEDVLAFAQAHLALDVALLAGLPRAVRRGDRAVLGSSFGIRPSETLDALVSYGRHMIPRSVAIGEARLELARAACVRWCATEFAGAMARWRAEWTTRGGVVP